MAAPVDYDPLDPFSEENLAYKTTEIRRSKSGKRKRKINNIVTESKSGKKPRTSLFKSVKTFFKELPERADKKRIYAFISVVVFALLTVVVLLIANIVSRLQIQREEEAREAIGVRTIEISNMISGFANEEVDEETIREAIYGLLPEVGKDSGDYASLILGLVVLYERNNQYQAAIDFLEDEQSDDSIGISNRIEFLLRLDSLYDKTNQHDKRKYTLERLLSFKATAKDITIEEGSWKEIREEIEETYYELGY